VNNNNIIYFSGSLFLYFGLVNDMIMSLIRLGGWDRGDWGCKKGIWS